MLRQIFLTVHVNFVAVTVKFTSFYLFCPNSYYKTVINDLHTVDVELILKLGCILKSFGKL